MCLYFALMYKTLGGYNWSDIFKATLPGDDECLATTESSIIEGSGFEASGDFIENETNILASAKELHTSFQGLKTVRNLD